MAMLCWENRTFCNVISVSFSNCSIPMSLFPSELQRRQEELQRFEEHRRAERAKFADQQRRHEKQRWGVVSVVAQLLQDPKNQRTCSLMQHIRARRWSILLCNKIEQEMSTTSKLLQSAFYWFVSLERVKYTNQIEAFPRYLAYLCEGSWCSYQRRRVLARTLTEIGEQEKRKAEQGENELSIVWQKCYRRESDK